MQYLFDQFGFIRMFECGLQGQQLVERQAEGVNVTLGQRLTLKSFGGHETDCAHDVADLRKIPAESRQFVPRLLREAEVGDPNHALLIEKQVRRLDVAVQDALAVSISQPLGDLHADWGDR